MGLNRRDYTEVIRKRERQLRALAPKVEAAKKRYDELLDERIDAERDLEGFTMALEEMDRQEGAA